MRSTLKILLLEDDPIDAELIQELLEKDLEPAVFNVAKNKKEFLKAITEFHPDLILCDHFLPQYDSLEALRVTRHHYPYVPFILITGAVSEDLAAGIIREGADDYILKDRMARLPAAVQAALKKRRAEKELADYKYAIDQSAIVAITDAYGEILYANDNFCRISGYEASELIGNNYSMLNSGYHSKLFMKSMWDTIVLGNTWRGEFCNRAKDRSVYWADSTIIPFMDSGKPYQYLSICFDITERKKVEGELHQSHADLRQLASYLQKVREDERTVISREIHDELGQKLTVMKMDASWLMKKVSSPNEVNDKIEKINDLMTMLNEMISTVRRISSELRPAILDDMGLMAAVENYLQEFEKRSGITTTLVKEEEELYLPDNLKTGLYRIIQESLTNVGRHAQAQNVTVNLQQVDGHVQLTIRDDGVGFNKNEISDKKTLGLLGMKERAIMMNGSYKVISAAGKGTTVVVTVPVNG